MRRLLLVATLILGVAALTLPATAQPRPGVPAQDAWTCPATHPIKGNFTTSSGERCIHHVPNG